MSLVGACIVSSSDESERDGSVTKDAQVERDAEAEVERDAEPEVASDAGPDAQRDADTGVPRTACSEHYQRIETYLAQNRECERDSDCTLVGSCSNMPLLPVNLAAHDEAARMLAAIAAVCRSSDGATSTPVCERGQCVARRSGSACGSVSNSCPSTHALYSQTCADEKSYPYGLCRQPCDGPSDTRCASGHSCQQTRVAAVRESCESPTLDAFLCMPVPSCDVVLSITAQHTTSLPSPPPPAPRPPSRAIRLAVGGSYDVTLDLWAENRTSETKTFRYRRPCPGGPALQGIGTYDAWGTCAAGACPDNPPTEVTLAPGERVSLGSPRIGATPDTCNRSVLMERVYDITFSLADVTGATVCGPEPLQLRL